MSMQIHIDLKSKFSSLYSQIRELLVQTYHLEEKCSARITSYSPENGQGGVVCHLKTVKNGVALGFMKGSELDDQYNCLTGNGKKVRVLELAGFDKVVICYYVEQAIFKQV